MSNLEKMRQTLNEFSGGGGKFWRLQTNRAVLRILPAINEDEEYLAAAFQHMMTLDGGVRGFRCLEDLGEWCPVCAAQKIFAGIGSNKWTEKAGELEKNAKFSMNIIVKGKKGKIFCWQATPGVVKQILEKHEGEWGDPSDPKNGWWFELSKKGSGMGTRYTVSPSPNGIGRIPSYVDLSERHVLASNDTIQVKKMSTLRHALIEKYSDQYPELEDELRLLQRRWERRKKKRDLRLKEKRAARKSSTKRRRRRTRED